MDKLIKFKSLERFQELKEMESYASDICARRGVSFKQETEDPDIDYARIGDMEWMPDIGVYEAHISVEPEEYEIGKFRLLYKFVL